jgi:hypothetical protein
MYAHIPLNETIRRSGRLLVTCDRCGATTETTPGSPPKWPVREGESTTTIQYEVMEDLNSAPGGYSSLHREFRLDVCGSCMRDHLFPLLVEHGYASPHYSQGGLP